MINSPSLASYLLCDASTKAELPQFNVSVLRVTVLIDSTKIGIHTDWSLNFLLCYINFKSYYFLLLIKINSFI